MSVVNGQLANQTTFNTAYVSRTVNTSTVGKLGLLNTDAESGDTIDNVQRLANSILSVVGMGNDQPATAVPQWQTGITTETIIQRIDSIFTKLNDNDPASGHTHDGSFGQGPKISANDLLNFNQYFCVTQLSGAATADFGATGVVMSDVFSGKVPGGGPSTVGVLTDGGLNRVTVVDSAGRYLETSTGERVYALLTDDFVAHLRYRDDSGVEQVHSLGASAEIRVYYREVYTQATRPTIGADLTGIVTFDMTADIVDAASNRRGVVSTGTQTFAGSKTFEDNVSIEGKFFLNQVTDSTASGVNVNLSNPGAAVLRVENANLESVSSIDMDDLKAQVIVFVNDTGRSVTLVNSLTPSTGDIVTGTGEDLTIADQGCAILVYDQDVWRVIGGAGGGGGSAIARTVTDFTDTAVTPAPEGDETFVYTGGSSQTFTGFGTLSDLTDGKRITLIGSDDENTLDIANTDTTNGWLTNGPYLLSRGSSIEFEYNETLARMVEISRNNI